MRKDPWKLVVALAGVVLLVSYGTRNSLPVFLVPVTEELGIGRESFSIAVAIQSIMFGLPFLPMLSDRIGSRKVLSGSIILLGASLWWFAAADTPIELVGSIGLLLGTAMAGGSFTVVFAAVGKATPVEYRSTALGVVGAIGSAGVLPMSLLTQSMIDAGGWRWSARWLIAVTAIALVAALFVPDRSEEADGPRPEGELAGILRRATRNRSYLLLVVGFFVCGFHVTFIGTHYPAFVTDQGLAPAVGALGIGLIGTANVLGSLVWGRLGDRYPKQVLLSLLYGARSVVIAGLLVLPMSRGVAYGFAIAVGLVWLGTAPLTSGVVGSIFGTRYMATLYGIVFFSHQLGGFLGSWLGGRFYDFTGSYTPVWLMAIALGVLASVIHLPIREERDATAIS